MDEKKQQKNKKILNIVVNVVVAVILLLALLVTINNVASKKRGYTALFGTAYMVVQSDSMEGPKPEQYADKLDGFKIGDLVQVKILSANEKLTLEEGDIISFFITQRQPTGEARVVNSHRIVEVRDDNDGNGIYYKTKGDNPKYGDQPDGYKVYARNTVDGTYCVIGKVTGNAGAIGHVLNFFNTSTGFLVCIVIPSFLIVIFFAVSLVREVLRLKKAGAGDQRAKEREAIIAELRAQGVQIPAELGGTNADAQAPPAEQEKEESASSEEEETK